MQEFFKSTIISKYIKQLLAKSPLPIYRVIYEKEDMIEGCLYSYKGLVLRCTKSGRFFGASKNKKYSGKLNVTNALRVQSEEVKDFMQIRKFNTASNEYVSENSPLVVTDNDVSFSPWTEAEFDIVNSYNLQECKPGITDVFKSKSNYYDLDTHSRLGEYLRNLRCHYGLDLMPLYNCFNYKVVDTFSLTTSAPYITAESNKRYKIMLVPIKFDRTYTIAYDSELPIVTKAVLYSNNLIRDEKKQEYMTSFIDETVNVYNSSSFNTPFTYSVPLVDKIKSASDLSRDKSNIELLKNSQRLHRFERYLYLAIQVPVQNSSTLVVLEGDYTKDSAKYIYDIEGKDSIEKENKLFSGLTLLSQNDQKQHPFAERLIEYLLRNTIDVRDTIDDNVMGIKKKIGYDVDYTGQWDNGFGPAIFNSYIDAANRRGLKIKDALGYVDSDIEEAVRRGYMIYDK